eukprot:CAMPEP_0167802756 /NCGR_PEP_ID=MMETSP0111_2-20121227/19334_1 /TAXON_ID=91324 /ORGANISM="Lotharella globosa, Strain CCCM811" /LENGTH=379 /DNA_ID=CAMNT_0007698903 /DNA_START=258 /DNA_END=1397 /DNA_ORIENTATION=-
MMLSLLVATSVEAHWQPSSPSLLSTDLGELSKAAGTNATAAAAAAAAAASASLAAAAADHAAAAAAPEKESIRLMDALPRLLKEAATEDHMAVITSLTYPYVDFAANTYVNLQHFGIHEHVVFIAEDHEAYRALSKITDRVVLSWSGMDIAEGVPAQYGDKAYGDVTKLRPSYMLASLDAGVHVVWTDVDIFYTQNILDVFRRPAHAGADIVAIDEGRDSGKHLHLCSGLIFVRNNERSRRTMEIWADLVKERADGTNQASYNKALVAAAETDKLTYHVLEELEACSGFNFWSHQRCTQTEAMIFAHNNYISGHGSKLERALCSQMWLLPCGFRGDSESELASSADLRQEAACNEFNSVENKMISRVSAAVARPAECPF